MFWHEQTGMDQKVTPLKRYLWLQLGCAGIEYFLNYTFKHKVSNLF